MKSRQKSRDGVAKTWPFIVHFCQEVASITHMSSLCQFLINVEKMRAKWSRVKKASSKILILQIICHKRWRVWSLIIPRNARKDSPQFPVPWSDKRILCLLRLKIREHHHVFQSYKNKFHKQFFFLGLIYLIESRFGILNILRKYSYWLVYS